MGRIRSLRIPAKVDVVLRAHNCKANKGHRLQRGDKRLKVRNGGGWSHYCLDCARKMIRRDIAALEALAGELDRGDGKRNP